MGYLDVTTNGDKVFCLSMGKPSYVNESEFGLKVAIGSEFNFHTDYFSEGSISKIRVLEYLINVKVENNTYTFTWQDYPVKDLEVGDKAGGRLIGNIEPMEDYRGTKKLRVTFTETEGPDTIAEYNLDAFLAGVTKKNPSIVLEKGNYYSFLQDDASNSGHPMVFKNGSSTYETDVINNFETNTPGTTGAFTRIKVTKDTPASLKYSCQSHGDSYGNTLNIEEGSVAVVVLFDTEGEKSIRITGGMGTGNYVTERKIMLSAEYDRSTCDTPENIKSLVFKNRPFAWHGYGEFAGMKNLTTLTLPPKGAVTMIKSLNPASKIQNVNNGEMHFVRTFAETKFTDNPGDPLAFEYLIDESDNVTKMVGTFEDSLWNGTLNWTTSKVKDFTNCFRNTSYTGKKIDFSAAEIIDGIFSGPNCKWVSAMNTWKFPVCTSAKRVFQNNTQAGANSLINGWNIPNVTSMQGFFQGSGRTEAFAITAPKCTDFSYFLSDTNSFNNTFSVSTDASNISVAGLLQKATGFSLNANWMWNNVLSKAVNLKDFFRGSNYTGVISQWFPDGHTVTNISGMFAEMTETYVPAMNSWDFGPLEDLSFLFENSKASMGWNTEPFPNALTCEGFYKNNIIFSNAGIRKWSFPACKNFSAFFQNTKTSIAALDWFLEGAHVGEDFSYMFADANLDRANTFDLRSAKNTSYMFLNQNLRNDVMGFKVFDNLEYSDSMFAGATYVGRLQNWRFPKIKSMKNMFLGATLSSNAAYTNTAQWFFKFDANYSGLTSQLEDISGIFCNSKNLTCNISNWTWVQRTVKKANRAFSGTTTGSCANTIPSLRQFRNLTEFNEILANATWVTNDCDFTTMLQDPEIIKQQKNMVKGTEYTGRWRDEVPLVTQNSWLPFIAFPSPRTVNEIHPCLENFQKSFDDTAVPEPPDFILKKNTIYVRIPTN